MPLICKLTYPKPYPLYLTIHPKRQYSALIIPRASYQTTRDQLYSLEPFKVIKLANLPLFTLPCPSVPIETAIKAMAISFPSLLPFHHWTNTSASPFGPAWDASYFCDLGL